jgi:hypothetical protein
MSALGATVEMPAQSCGATALNREQDPYLRPCQPRAVSVNEVIAHSADDIGQLKSRPLHFGSSFRDLRTRLASAICRASSGLAAECK